MAYEGMFKLGGAFNLMTVTAPGGERHCKKKGCSATDCQHEICLCTPAGGIDLGEWNPTASKKWNHLLVLIQREYGVRPQYFRAVECQDGKRAVNGCGRLALHFHVLMRSDVVMDRRTLRKLAIEAGFGHELDLQDLVPGSRKAAKYVSKYVTKSCDDRDDVPWLVEALDGETGELTREPAPATFRTWSQSKAWGTTMAAICVDLRRRWELHQMDAQLAEDQGANAECGHANNSSPAD